MMAGLLAVNVTFALMKEELVILVDEQDRELGTMEKQRAHVEGVLHRAFSVFIFDSKGRLLLQQRAAGKYHSGGLWTNTCCSHPRPGEPVAGAAQRRLGEEMGIRTSLEPLFTMVYKSAFDNGLTEHEYDHIFTGRWEGDPRPDPAEVDDWKWLTPEEALRDAADRPEAYTAWYKMALSRVLERTRGL